MCVNQECLVKEANINQRIFISHSSKDKPAVEQLALELHQRGFDPWFDKWEIQPGDDIVASINRGLEEMDAGIVVFSEHTIDSDWIQHELSYLILKNIEDGVKLIPILIGDNKGVVPPLVRPKLYIRIDEVQCIDDALHNRREGPPPRRAGEQPKVQQVEIRLRGGLDGAIEVACHIDETLIEQHQLSALSTSLHRAREVFQRGPRHTGVRDAAQGERASLQANLERLGDELCALCLPGAAETVLADLITHRSVGHRIDLVFDADTTALLSLPFEALRLPDGRVLSLQPNVVVLRRPAGVTVPEAPRLAPPLKILAAVGAPDEGKTASALLDYERELAHILDATEQLSQDEGAQTRILEVGHPDQINLALHKDAYHILHLSGHGAPGFLELETEDGEAAQVTARQLVDALSASGRPLPLVFLNSCHGGVHDAENSSSFAEQLLRAGIPAVLAMQTAVSDDYATELAHQFYAALARRELLRPGVALADARKQLEKDRLQAISANTKTIILPEYATPTLFVADQDRPIADFGLDKQPLRNTPVQSVAGDVPQLTMDELVGRRKPLRDGLRILRASTQPRHLAITGIGGIGKSALAGRMMQRMKEGGYRIVTQRGVFDLNQLVTDTACAIDEIQPELAAKLLNSQRPDVLRFKDFKQALNSCRILVVLDDFEENLSLGGGSFIDPDLPDYLIALFESANTARFLLTSRYPPPGLSPWLHSLPLKRLSPAEGRKMLRRLPALNRLSADEQQEVLTLFGSHPRTLALLDALLNGNKGRLPDISKKLQELLAEHGQTGISGELKAAIDLNWQLGARDILLDALLDQARRDGTAEALLQLAVSNLPVSAAGLAHMLNEDSALEEAAHSEILSAMRRLADLSLIQLEGDQGWVHRWTAEGLKALDDNTAQRCARAGRYREWRVTHETKSLIDGIEATRNYLDAQEFDTAGDWARSCIAAMKQFQQLIGVTAFAAEVLERLPDSHPTFSILSDEEAKAHLALGKTDQAKRRYETLLVRYQHLAQAEPDRADYQRDLSVSYNKMGDLFRALGQGEQAREAFQQALAIRERLAQAEPDRADYQRDLVVSLAKMGDASPALAGLVQLEQAMQVLIELERNGGLSPVDAPMIPALDELIQQKRRELESF